MSFTFGHLRRCHALDALQGRRIINIEIRGEISSEVTLRLNNDEVAEIKMALAVWGFVDDEEATRKMRYRPLVEVHAFCNSNSWMHPGLYEHNLYLKTDTGKMLALVGRTYAPLDTPIAVMEIKKIRRRAPEMV